jgi:hypothetical protein
MSGVARWEARVTNRYGLPGSSGDLVLTNVQQGQLAFLDRFASNCTTMQLLAEKELQEQPFEEEEESFLLDLVEKQRSYTGRNYTGWYPRLYYGAYEGFDLITSNALARLLLEPQRLDFMKPVALVADVLTAPPDAIAGDAGAVLHEAVGRVNFMMVAVQNGSDRMVFGGPVYSHYEFNLSGVQRMNDTEWQSKLQSARPVAPEWTRAWLVPSSP